MGIHTQDNASLYAHVSLGQGDSLFSGVCVCKIASL